MKNSRIGLSLVETLVVLAIIAGLLGLLLPAVQTVRERARDAVCKNNVHQLNLALVNFEETHKKLPSVGRTGVIGGWTIDVLPFIEEQNLHASIKTGSDLSKAPKQLFVPPSIFRCPRSLATEDSAADKMTRGHYTFVTSHNRTLSAGIYDSPTRLDVAWVSGPEMDWHAIRKEVGPHHNGFHFSRGNQQGVGFLLNGEEVN